LIINTPLGRQSHYDDNVIRRAATQHGVACITTLSGAAAATNAISTLQREKLSVLSLQEYHGTSRKIRSLENVPVSTQAHTVKVTKVD
jgi:carbamoyl-phosphate synthase large subunit